MAIYLCNGAAAPLVLLLLAGGAAMPSDRYPAGWNKVRQETLEPYTNVLRWRRPIRRGNESKIVRYVKDVRDREGVTAQLFDLDPERAHDSGAHRAIDSMRLDIGSRCIRSLADVQSTVRLGSGRDATLPHDDRRVSVPHALGEGGTSAVPIPLITH